MKHSWLFILILIVVIGIVLGAFSNPFVDVNNQITKIEKDKKTTQPASYNAAFAIFTNNTFRVFTASMYHNQSADVFIENPDPNIIHVKKQDVTFDAFFQTLPFQISKECLITGTGEKFCNGDANRLRFFLNGVETPNALDLVIQPNDKLLITFGNLTSAQIKSQEAKIPTP